MTRMFTKIIALTWLVIAIVALTRDSRSPSEQQPNSTGLQGSARPASNR